MISSANLRCIFALSLLCVLSQAEAPKKPGKKAPPRAKPNAQAMEELPNPADIKLVEFFSVDKNPGTGSLSYVHSANTEIIKLGPETGLYALGMIFPGQNLPEPYNKDFKKSDIIQLAFGTLKSSLQLQIPQFGAATLISDGPLKRKTSFKLMVPSGKEKSLKNIALLLFTSPQTPNEQSDEEKLKGTYFAQSGTITISPKGKLESVVIKSQGRKYNFRVQVMALEFKAKLATPFNAQENDLTGVVEFPVYWPSGQGAKALAKRIAGDSLTGMGPVPMPEGLSSHKRNVAGSTKKDTGQAPASPPRPAEEPE